MPYREEGDTPSEPDPHPLDAVIWRALTSVQKSLAEGNERARRYPAAIAPFAATIDTEPASFRSLLALLGGDDQIALFTTADVFSSNHAAIALYRKLGFALRRRMHLAVLVRAETE